MEIKIYTNKGVVRHVANTTHKDSIRRCELMGDNIVQPVFNHTEELRFKAGDNITYKGEKFSLIQDYKAEVVNEYEYHYELKFEGAEGYLKTLPFFHYITNGATTEKEPEVNYTATLAMTAEMAIMSLRKASGDNTWEVGVLAEGYESKYLNFSADSIFDAFGKIADEFKTEWWLEGKKVNFCRCERGDLQTFSAKAGRGLSSVDIQTNNDIIPNRIYAYGSDRNITKKYTADGIAYNTRLRLPNGVEYVDVTGGAENIISKTVFFDNDEVGDIYPRRVGSITATSTPLPTSKDQMYYFFDNKLDFDPHEQLIDGTTMMVHFESGMLQGRDFEVACDKNSKRFGIFSSQEGEVQIPFGRIAPKVGDKYILWNMKMPESYITNAEQELLTVAQKYVDNLNKKTSEIVCESFEPYFDEYGKVVLIGSKIKIEDDRLKGGYVQSRVTKYSYPLFCESQVEFTLAENVSSGRISQIENRIEDVTADNAQNVQSTRAVSRRAWRDAQELTAALEALQAELVLVGNPESQFSCSCVFKSNKNNNPNLLAVSTGELQHVVYKGLFGDKWAVEDAEFTLASDTLHYIYFKCSKSTNKGHVIISQTRLELESQEGYYLFLGGVVSSIFENARIVNIVSGFTQIAGGNITTERIQDPTGNLIIDLASNPPRIIARNGAKLIGSFSFESAEGIDNIAGIDDMKGNISAAQDSANAAQSAADAAIRAAQEAQNYIDTTLPDEMQEINRRLDGVVESWFLPYTPTLNNDPTRAWITAGKQNQHIGDTFTNTQSFAFNPNDSREWEQGSSNGATNKPWEGDLFDNTKRLRTPNMLRVNGSVKISVTNGGIAVYYAATADGNLTGHQGWLNSVQINQTDHPYIALVLRINDTTPILPTDTATLGLVVEGDLSHVDAGKSWRWVDEGGYKWTPIADSDAVKALLEASKAQDLADQKRRVFVVQPTTPYEVGDMWAQGASGSGDLMRCIVSRPTGSFTTGDWDKASKYTDDAVVMDRIAKMANDKVITKEEKATLRNDLVQINTAYAAYQSDATKYGVSITALATAKTALSTLLTSTVKISTNEDTTLTDAQLVAYNKAFADYSAEVQRFANLVSKKQADDAVNNLQIGANNLINGSKSSEPWEGRSDKYLIAAWSAPALSYIEEGKTYTVVAELYCDQEFADAGRGIGFNVDGYQLLSPYFKPTTPTVVSTTFVAKRSGRLHAYHYTSGTPGHSFINWVKLVQGDKASLDWTPSQADTQAEIDKAQQAANTANTAIDAMNDDEVFDLVEKQTIRTQWEAISGIDNVTHTEAEANGSYKKVVVMAGNNVPVATLTTVYNSLKANLNNNDLYGKTNKTGFNRETMATAFATYYNEEAAILDRISRGYVDNLEIGGVNLLPRSKDITAYASIGFGTTRVVSGKYMRFTINSSEQIYAWGHIVSNKLNFSNIFAISSCYTFSAKLKASKEMTARIGFRTVGGGIVYDKKYTVGAGDCIISINFTYRGEDPMYPIISFWNINDTPLTPNDWIEVEYFMVEKGSKATDWSPSQADTQAEIDKAQTAADAANKAVRGLNAYVDGAFRDGIVDTSEAKAIAEQIKNINEAKAASESSYATIYSNPILEGTAKTNLATAKTDLDTKRTALITAINSIVANKRVTDVLRKAYDTAYPAYTTSYGTFSNRLTEATKSIEDAIKDLADSKSTHYTSSEAPLFAKTGDTWAPFSKGTNYTYYAGTGWQLTSDNTKTVINGGVVTASTIQVGQADNNGNPTGNTKAGLSGVGTSDGDIRIWAGRPYSLNSQAPFRVTQGGVMYASGAVVENSKLNNVTIKGSLIGPISAPTGAFASVYSDNSMVNSSLAGGVDHYTIPWDVNQAGRVIRLINYRWKGISSTGSAGIHAPSGKYFFENGNELGTINISREYIELFGYGDPESFYGWIVVNRISLMSI